MFYLFYLAIVFSTVLGLLPISIAVILIIICLSYWFFLDRDIIYIAPCIVSPFFILFRAQDLDNLIGAIIVDFFMFFSFFYFLYNASKKDYFFPRYITSIPLIALLAHLLYTCLNGFLYFPPGLAYMIFLRMYGLPIVYLLTLILAVQQNVRLVRKGLSYFFLSISVVVSIALAQYLNLFQIPTKEWAYFGRYFISGETVNLQTEAGTVSERALLGFTGIRMNLLLGGSLGTAAAIVFCLSIVQLFFYDILYFKNRVFSNIIAIISITASVLTFSTSIVTPIFWLLFWAAIYKKVSVSMILIFGIVVLMILLNFQIMFETSPLDYFSESIGESIFSLYRQNILKNWLIGVGPSMYVSGYFFRPENYITDVGIFKVMQESGVINMFFVVVFIVFIFISLFKSLRVKLSKEKILCAIILSTCLTSVHVNSMIQTPFNILFAFAISGCVIPERELQSKLLKMKF